MEIVIVIWDILLVYVYIFTIINILSIVCLAAYSASKYLVHSVLYYIYEFHMIHIISMITSLILVSVFYAKKLKTKLFDVAYIIYIG